MRGLIGWWRGRSALLDGLFAGLVLLVDLPAAALNTVPLWLWASTSVLLAAPIAVRRRWPRTAASVVLAGAALWLATHEEPTAFHFALISALVLLYSLIVHADRRAATVFAAALTVGVVVYAALRIGPGGLLILLWLAVPWALGTAVLSAHTRGAEVTRRAAAEERVAIARDVHDILAHTMSVMVVLADGAGAQVRTDPERAEQALQQLGRTGRSGLVELRRALAALRGPVSGAETRSGLAAPLDHGAGLVELAERMSNAGLPTRLTLTGSTSGLPGTVAASLHRIAQESLTNVLRHGGAGARATVEVVVRAAEVELCVHDTGTIARSAGPAEDRGDGLRGMRERAQACGGTLSAGPAPGRHGWTVHAVLPW